MDAPRKPVITTAALAVLALGAAACHPARLGHGRPRDDRPMAVNARLDCPERQGDLQRADQAADGRSCRYTGDDGEEVTLSVLALNGQTAAAALAPTEASLRALVPAAVPGSPENAKAEAASKQQDDSDGDDDDNKGDGAKGHDDKGAGAVTAASADAQANVTEGGAWNDDDHAARSGGRHDRDHVAVNLPGIHLDADDNGAHVHAFGQDVDADDDGAQVHSGWNGVKSEIHANDGGEEIRSGWAGQHALDQSYLLSSDTAGPDGVKAAAYYVRGPVAGPLVLAVVKARSGRRDHDEDRFHDARRLVRRNTHFQ